MTEHEAKQFTSRLAEFNKLDKELLDAMEAAAKIDQLTEVAVTGYETGGWYTLCKMPKFVVAQYLATRIEEIKTAMATI